MIYEHRTYTCFPGRLPALLNRFENVTFGIWARHGIRQAGFWTTETDDVLEYLLVWESVAERDERWSAFASDPEWLAAKAASETPDKIVESIETEYWTPTAFSSVQ